MRDHADNVRGHLLDRELRPDGRAHRRLDHRRARADAHRRRVPARCATPRSRASAASASRPAARTSSSRSNPTNGDMVVIEMNPRVSRSSALASKATGFPIAKIAAKLAVGYRLDEITQRHHRRDAGVSSSRPSTTSSPRCRAGRSRSCPARRRCSARMMQSVGEVMAIGRTFPESLQKALRSLETGRLGPQLRSGASASSTTLDDDELVRAAAVPTPERLFQLEAALRRGVSVERARTRRPASTRGSSTRSLADRRGARRGSRERRPRGDDARATGAGRSGSASPTRQLAYLWGVDRGRRARRAARRRRATSPTRPSTRARPSSRRSTPYHYGTYEDEDEVAPARRSRRS